VRVVYRADVPGFCHSGLRHSMVRPSILRRHALAPKHPRDIESAASKITMYDARNPKKLDLLRMAFNLAPIFLNEFLSFARLRHAMKDYHTPKIDILHCKGVG
jgi:hypothetical protein